MKAKIEGKLGRDFKPGKTSKGIAIGTIMLFTSGGKVLCNMGGKVAQSAEGLRRGDEIVVQGDLSFDPWFDQKTGVERIASRMKVCRWDMKEEIEV